MPVWGRLKNSFQSDFVEFVRKDMRIYKIDCLFYGVIIRERQTDRETETLRKADWENGRDFTQTDRPRECWGQEHTDRGETDRWERKREREATKFETNHFPALIEGLVVVWCMEAAARDTRNTRSRQSSRWKLPSTFASLPTSQTCPLHHQQTLGGRVFL